MNSHTLAALTGFTLCILISGCFGPDDSTVTIFTARNIITMDTEVPTAEAVAVKGDKIIALGNLVTLQEQFLGQDTFVDSRFVDKVIMPGFIDPHIHPSIAATILPMEIVAAMAWPTAEGFSEPVRSPESFLARLKQLDQKTPPGEWLMAWGYHKPYHGPMNKKLLDQVSTERLIMVWQRSVHEMFFNSKALAELGLSQEDFAAEPHSNWQDGHIWETALFSLGEPIMKKIATPSSYLQGLSLMSDLIHRAGVTTLGEQGFPQVSTFLEYWSLKWESYNRPYRFALVPNAMFFGNQVDSVGEVLDAANDLLRNWCFRVPERQ